MKWPFVLQSILLITLNGYTSIPKRLFAENDIVLYRYIASLKTLRNDFYSICHVNRFSSLYWPWTSSDFRGTSKNLGQSGFHFCFSPMQWYTLVFYNSIKLESYGSNDVLSAVVLYEFHKSECVKGNLFYFMKQLNM